LILFIPFHIVYEHMFLSFILPHRNLIGMRREKQDHFFVSIAHHVPEHASQAASRGSEAAMTPLEKHIS